MSLTTSWLVETIRFMTSPLSTAVNGSHLRPNSATVGQLDRTASKEGGMSVQCPFLDAVTDSEGEVTGRDVTFGFLLRDEKDKRGFTEVMVRSVTTVCF